MDTCHKVRHPNRVAAEIALKHFQASCRRRGSKIPTGTYWCATCLGSHVTSKSPSRPASWQRKGQTGRARGKAAAAKP